MSYIWHLLFSLLRLLLLFDVITPNSRTNGEPLSPRSIKTKYGFVRGVLRHYDKQDVPELPSPLYRLPNRFSVEIFRSVPFAQPPISNLRFLPPVTQNRWRGTKLSNRFLPVCMQNTAEIASSDLLAASPHEAHPHHVNSTVNSTVNRDKIHDASLSTSTLSSVSSSSVKSSSSSTLSTSSRLTSVPTTSMNNRNLQRTKRQGTFSAIKSNGRMRTNTSATVNVSVNKHSKPNSKPNGKLNSTLPTDRRSARSTDDVNGQFDRYFISNLLRIHPAYFQPFASYVRNQNEDCLYLNLYVPYDGKLTNKSE